MIEDVFAELIRAFLVVVLASSVWLAGDFRDDRPASFPKWINPLIVIALMACMWALIALDSRKVTWTTPLLLGVAFNLGRWAATRERRESITHIDRNPLVNYDKRLR